MVLDIGCGSGDVTNDILLPVLDKIVEGKGGKGGKANSNPTRTRRKSQVVGVDVSVEMIKHAEDK